MKSVEEARLEREEARYLREERLAIMEFDGRMPRPVAEKRLAVQEAEKRLWGKGSEVKRFTVQG